MKRKSERKVYPKKRDETTGSKEKPRTSNKPQTPRCNTCGMPDHEAKNCPEREKGPKCFKCNTFGHIANRCPNQENSSNTASVHCISKSRTTRDVQINDMQCRALIDSGSELSLISKARYQEAGSASLEATPTVVTGAGNAMTQVIGTFENNVRMEKQEYNLKLFVVPTHAIPYDVILGQDVLANVEIHLLQGKIVRMHKVQPTNGKTEDVPAEVANGKEV